MKTGENTLRLLVAVGSRHDRVCSIGAFARAEAEALAAMFKSVEVLEPDANDFYPAVHTISKPDVIFFHAPSLHDRKRPWNALSSALKIKRAFPEALFIAIVHEYSEAPLHWKIRQLALTKLANGVVVNSAPDYEGVRRWYRNVLRTSLGPTLYIKSLLESEEPTKKLERLEQMQLEARQFISKKFFNEFKDATQDQWILNPGLLTPGKGVGFLSQLAPVVSRKGRLVLMGGIGPKQRDRDFAKDTINQLRAVMDDRLIFINSPDDATFRQMLLASDLVVLPYDNGLSERRSSFLSAMCCGANIWTTVGEYTSALGIENTGVHQSRGHGIAEEVSAALSESVEKMDTRRLKNLAWASKRSWQSRANALTGFISSLR